MVRRREVRLYDVRRPEGEKDLLIIDVGVWRRALNLLDIHVYEHNKSYSSKEIEEEMKKQYPKEKLPKVKREITRLWIEKKFGHSTRFKLIPE